MPVRTLKLDCSPVKGMTLRDHDQHTVLGISIHTPVKGVTTPTRKKNLEETERKYRGTLEQLSRL